MAPVREATLLNAYAMAGELKRKDSRVKKKNRKLGNMGEKKRHLKQKESAAIHKREMNPERNKTKARPRKNKTE